MTRKVTIKQIADELGLSRNTVSKAINNNGLLAPATRQKILNTAMEMGYRQLPASASSMNYSYSGGKDVALLTASMPLGAHWASAILMGIEKVISQHGFRLVVYCVQQSNLRSLTLPQNFSKTQTCAILCAELYGLEYMDVICRLNLPTLFIDCTPRMRMRWPNADLLMMENEDSISSVVQSMIDRKVRTFGYIGDPEHCQSFLDRYTAARRTVLAAGLPDIDQYSVLEADDPCYGDANWLADQIRSLPALPQAFICANDFLALSTMRALHLLGKRVPDDVLVSGFDNQPESINVVPPLTTVAMYNSEMGVIGADLLLSRMRKPTIPSRIMHVHTDPIFRGSTGN